MKYAIAFFLICSYSATVSAGKVNSCVFNDDYNRTIYAVWTALGCAHIYGGKSYACNDKEIPPRRSACYTYRYGTSKQHVYIGYAVNINSENDDTSYLAVGGTRYPSFGDNFYMPRPESNLVQMSGNCHYSPREIKPQRFYEGTPVVIGNQQVSQVVNWTGNVRFYTLNCSCKPRYDDGSAESHYPDECY